VSDVLLCPVFVLLVIYKYLCWILAKSGVVEEVDSVGERMGEMVWAGEE
jgi:hypothetical protein